MFFRKSARGLFALEQPSFRFYFITPRNVIDKSVVLNFWPRLYVPGKCCLVSMNFDKF